MHAEVHTLTPFYNDERALLPKAVSYFTIINNESVFGNIEKDQEVLPLPFMII